MQLTTEQRTYIIECNIRRGSYQHVQEQFAQRFPNRNSPSKSSIQAIIEKFQEKGSILNQNKGNSGRRVTVVAWTKYTFSIFRNISLALQNLYYISLALQNLYYISIALQKMEGKWINVKNVAWTKYTFSSSYNWK